MDSDLVLRIFFLFAACYNLISFEFASRRGDVSKQLYHGVLALFQTLVLVHIGK